jgi:hypothetical protein
LNGLKFSKQSSPPSAVEDFCLLLVSDSFISRCDLLDNDNDDGDDDDDDEDDDDEGGVGIKVVIFLNDSLR